jgi:hypothetical protein
MDGMDPIRFTFGVHVHQPVGNFDHVFEQHVREVYMPFLEKVTERDFFPIALHVSGSLLEWLEHNDARYLDRLARLAGDGKVEMLLAGYYEPVLAALPREDRLEQIAWMREALSRRFGVDATGLWLTERVWEPGLAADLADAGVRFALVDDRHFLVTGFPRERLHAPYWTETGGKRVALFPIDERLRYLIPFQPPADTAAYLRELRAAGHRLAVLADDGEKFGGWPGTREWVYDKGWLDDFMRTMGGLVASGEVMMSTFADALAHVPSGGLAYLPTASYREMELWSLPTPAALRLEKLEKDMGHERATGMDGALVRGAHWRNFQVKYAESNRLHKKMVALSTLCRERGDPPAARRAIARAQCNDAYWHGVFGGLYLPHLRNALWEQLAIAEGELRVRESLAVDLVDIDCDGHVEIWLHGERASVIVSPQRGGVVEEYTLFGPRVNYADTLTRRRESYHKLEEKTPAGHAKSGDSAPSIHDIEQGLRMKELPPVDAADRALFQDRVLPAGLTRARYERAEYQALASWAAVPFERRIEGGDDWVEVVLTPLAVAGAAPVPMFEKRIRFHEDGRLHASYVWDPAAFPADAYFAPELSIRRPEGAALGVRCDPEPSATWEYAIETVSKSEQGLDRTVQGHAVTPLWPVRLGRARIELVPPARAAEDAATPSPISPPIP